MIRRCFNCRNVFLAVGAKLARFSCRCVQYKKDNSDYNNDTEYNPKCERDEAN